MKRFLTFVYSWITQSLIAMLNNKLLWLIFSWFFLPQIKGWLKDCRTRGRNGGDKIAGLKGWLKGFRTGVVPVFSGKWIAENNQINLIQLFLSMIWIWLTHSYLWIHCWSLLARCLSLFHVLFGMRVTGSLPHM